MDYELEFDGKKLILPSEQTKPNVDFVELPDANPPKRKRSSRRSKNPEDRLFRPQTMPNPLIIEAWGAGGGGGIGGAVGVAGGNGGDGGNGGGGAYTQVPAITPGDMAAILGGQTIQGNPPTPTPLNMQDYIMAGIGAIVPALFATFRR
jgi:hypothetical protein